MRLLIDTHILIGFLEGNNLLSKPRRQIVADSNNEVQKIVLRGEKKYAPIFYDE